MKISTKKFKGYRCFKDQWAGFERISPINVIIGRNNSGKSQLLEFVQSECSETTLGESVSYYCTGILDEDSLRQRFNEDGYGNGLSGNHWNSNGRLFVEKTINWEMNSAKTIVNCELLAGVPDNPNNETQVTRDKRLRAICREATYALTSKKFRRLYADRDIRMEVEDKATTLSGNGAGATNIIRRFENSSSLDREVIQVNFLKALNEIFGPDGSFTKIEAKHHDEGVEGILDKWEIYLTEDSKGRIPLSNSGSGLKTIILVLLNLVIIPVLDKASERNYVFALEELENNLHPALLRRLFRYLENYVSTNHAILFLTTHSSVALDYFGTCEGAQFIHVSHDGVCASTRTISAHLDHLHVVSELGVKASDLLQSNGIIWVEGPSDRIYLNRWIELLSEGTLREGRDYQCAFYGGSLLARTQIVVAEQEDSELVNLFRINPNIYVICDGDRTAKSGGGSRIKGRVKRIKAEAGKVNRPIWVSEAKEIENYIPGVVLSDVFEKPNLPDPEMHERFFPSSSKTSKSYIETKLFRKTIDKVELALLVAPRMTQENMSERFDFEPNMQAIITEIKKWNA